MWRGVCVFGAGSLRRSRKAYTWKWICAHCVRYACCDRSNLSPAYRVSSAPVQIGKRSNFWDSRLLDSRKTKEVSRCRESSVNKRDLVRPSYIACEIDARIHTLNLVSKVVSRVRYLNKAYICFNWVNHIRSLNYR